MIPFENIGTQLSQAFDNDLITFISDDWDNTNRYPDGVPCHLSIKTTDDPDDATIIADSRVPIQMYAQLNFANDICFKAKDYVRVEKHDQNGDVIVTYEGRVGVPAYRQARGVAQMKINTVIKAEPEPPVPPSTLYTVDIYGDDGEGGHMWINGTTYTCTLYNDGHLEFTSGWRDKTTYIQYYSGYAGYMRVSSGLLMRDHTNTNYQFKLTSNPAKNAETGIWEANYQVQA